MRVSQIISVLLKAQIKKYNNEQIIRDPDNAVAYGIVGRSADT
jgi:hypothetical protein